MPKTELLDTDSVISSWLSSGDDESPAGPLFTGGKYAEADIIGAIIRETRGTCSSCTASRGSQCC